MSERVILDGAPIFRGVRFGALHVTTGQLTHRAFLLCRPDETGLSISEIQANALTSLKNLKGTARLIAGEVRQAAADGEALGLQVVPMVQQVQAGLIPDPGYGQVLGLPPYPLDNDDVAQILANEVADVLLQLATYCPR